MNRGGGGGLKAGIRGLSLTGLIQATWKVGCDLMDLGSLSLTATGGTRLEEEGPEWRAILSGRHVRWEQGSVCGLLPSCTEQMS